MNNIKVYIKGDEVFMSDKITGMTTSITFEDLRDLISLRYVIKRMF